MNCEGDNTMDSTEIFSYFIIYSYLVVLFLKRNLKKSFKGRMGASGKQREKSVQIGYSLSCGQGQGNNTSKVW